MFNPNLLKLTTYYDFKTYLALFMVVSDLRRLQILATTPNLKRGEIYFFILLNLSWP